MSIDERPENVEEVSQVTDVKEEVTEAKNDAPMSFMEQALKDMDDIREGKQLNCIVIEVKSDGLIVDCGQKKDGWVSAEEIGSEKALADFKPGDEFVAKLIKASKDSKDFLALSKKSYDNEINAKRIKEEADKLLAEGEFEVEVTKAIEGGLKATFYDYSVFIPNSHIDRAPFDREKMTEEDLAKFEEKKKALVGQKIKVRKLPDKNSEKEGNKRGKSIVCSRKSILISQYKKEKAMRENALKEKKAREEEEKKNIFAANADRFKVNTIVPGTVTKFVSFGVFVNVYGFDCLCPINEISWSKEVDPATVLEAKKEYEFVVTKVDPEALRVTLSYKKLQDEPYTRAEQKYPVGSIIKGTVQTIVKFGAFVSIEPGVDGMIHRTEISYTMGPKEEVSDYLKPGQEVEAKVIKFQDKRIGLSIKQLTEAPARPENPAKGGKKPERNQTDRKPAKKNEDAYESQIEKDNYASYGASETASNLAFADMLKALNVKNEDKD